MENEFDLKAYLDDILSKMLNEGSEQLAELVRSISAVHHSEVSLVLEDFELSGYVKESDDSDKEAVAAIDPALFPPVPSDKGELVLRDALKKSYRLEETEPWAWRWVPYLSYETTVDETTDEEDVR